MLDRYEECLGKAKGLPRGELKIALLEEAIRIADIHGDIRHRFDARMKLTYETIFYGHGQKAIVAFAWCLAQYDRDPQLSYPFQMMWYYKWVVDRLLMFPDIPLSKVEEMLEDLLRRFRSLGHHSRYYYTLKAKLAMDRDQHDQAAVYYEKWLEEPRDGLDDCNACELSSRAELLLYLGRLEEALEITKPIFSGQISCHSVPHSTYSHFLVPLLRAGQDEKAAKFHEKGYGLIANQGKEYIAFVHNHLHYLAIVNQDKALDCLETFLPFVAESTESLVKYRFYVVASLLLDELKSERAIQMPTNVTAKSIKQELQQLAQTFDQQNQTTIFTRQIDQLHKEIFALRP